MYCEMCGHPVAQRLTPQEYEERARPRLARMETLAKRIDWNSGRFEFQPEYEQWKRLLDAQAADEVAAGL